MHEKAGILKYVKIVKKIFLAVSFVCLPAAMVLLVFACMGNIVCIVLAAVLILGYLVLYGTYALRVSMGTVIGIDVHEKTVNLRTKRKTWTYDRRRGCVAMRVKKNKFIATFQTQDSRDSFIFYRRVLFSKYSEEQFTADEMRLFYPQIDDLTEE